MRAIVVLGIAGTVAIARADTPPPPLVPDDYDRLGRLERVEVDAVLAARGRVVDRAPAGKIMREILVVTRPVFAASDGGFLTFFNYFHATTREKAIRRELLLQPGDPWDQDRVDEALRGLRDPLFHNVLVILPLVTEDAARVDVLVVARDVWSLRVASRYDLQGLDIINLQISLTENNLFGWRKRAAVSMVMDQGDVEIGPSYYDPSVGGTHTTLRSLARLIFARHGGQLEGTHTDSTFAYPFRSLRQPWGAQLDVAHFVGVERSFRGLALRTYDAPETAAVEAVPWVYDRRELATQLEVVRQLGTGVIQRLGAGHELSLARPRLPDDFEGDEALRTAFSRDVLPRSELVSAPFVHWVLFTPVYVARRDLDTFDFREDYRLGPTLEARAALALDALGSDHDFLRFSATASWTAGWGGGLYRAGGGFGARLQDGRLVDRTSTVTVLAASPILGRVLRLVAAADLDVLDEEEGNRFFTLGGSNGLRGYAVNQLTGLARLIAHVELRTRPLHISFLRLGAVAFWDFGDAADAPRDLSLKHGIGAGGRLLIPQLDPLVIRLDWAFALNGASRGFPGRFILGVEQFF